MRTLNLAPLHRATVGFDQITDMMDRIMASDSGNQSYPPYNIEKTADDSWRISIAVAGFSDEDLQVEVKENALHVTANKAEDEAERTYLHRGIATRAFSRRFHLADHVKVMGASHENGDGGIDADADATAHRDASASAAERRGEIRERCATGPRSGGVIHRSRRVCARARARRRSRTRSSVHETSSR